MAMGYGNFCYSCHSHSCHHDMNSLMRDMQQQGMQSLIRESIASLPEPEVIVKEKKVPNKKLLLLGR